MIDALRRLVGMTLLESDVRDRIERFLAARHEAESVTDETPPEERERKIEDFMAAKAGGGSTTSGVVLDIRNMWLVPFVRVRRSRQQQYQGVYGRIKGLKDERLRFEFHPRTSYVMTKPGRVVPFVEAVDRLKYNKRDIPDEFPIVVPLHMATSNPALKAAIEQGGLVRPVTLNVEARTLRHGHDDEAYAREKQLRRAAHKRIQAQQAAFLAHKEAVAKAKQAQSDELKGLSPEEVRRKQELDALQAAQAAEEEGGDSSPSGAKEWDDLVDDYYYGGGTYDDEYAPGGDFQDEFEREFERQNSL